MKRVFPSVLFACVVWTSTPSFAGSLNYTQLCWESNGSSPDAQTCSFSGGADSIHTITPNPGFADQVFDGSATAIATNDTWKMAFTVGVTDYRRDMYVWHPAIGLGGSEVAFAADAVAGLNDTITVSGGTGIYSLSYIFSLDGTLDTTDGALLSPQFCAALILAQGSTTSNSLCLGPGNVVPSTFTLTYTDLPFGGVINSTLQFNVDGSISALFPEDVPTLGASTITGNMAANFGDTVHLISLLMTDSNGNPIRGVTISSQDGINYPLDPRNSAVPEPAWLTPLGLLSLAALLRRRRHCND